MRRILRRIEFNKTESEVLVKLVDSAGDKGEKIKMESRRLSNLSEKVADTLDKEGFFRYEDDLSHVDDSTNEKMIGIDGSFFPIGGVGGLWYVPYSVVRVIFPEGLGQKCRIDVFAADIEEIDEQEHYSVNTRAEVVMILGETKALSNWAQRNEKSIVIIDGPIVDPPWYSDDAFVKERCRALSTCLKHSTVIGCVKRSRDRYFLDSLVNREGIAKKHVAPFPSDQHLFSYIFSQLRKKRAEGPIYTNSIEVSEDGKAVGKYKDNGIRIFSMVYQRGLGCTPVRYDVPVLNGDPQKMNRSDESRIARIVTDWSYPGYDFPLPVIIAHEKCSIRKGCAEVLYYEIMTRSRSADRVDQLAQVQLR